MDDARKKIMLVDDDQSILQTGRTMLKAYYDVFPLPSADKLFEALKKITPDLLLLDIMMPGIGGFEIIKLFKSEERFSKTPVIFLTATCDRDSVLKGIHLGASDFVLKPFEAEDLLHRIENHLCAEEKAKRSVLVVDDSPEILMSVFTMLRDLYRIYTLPEPEKLGEFLQNNTPDLILVDYKMPAISGFEIIPLIRDFPKHRETPVVFLTGDSTAENLFTAHDLGICDFIVKPFESDVLREKIAKHI